MTDAYLLLTPLLVLGVLGLIRFIGCNWLFGLEETDLTLDGPQVIDAVALDQSVQLSWEFTQPVSEFTIKYGTVLGGPYPNTHAVVPGPNGKHQAVVAPLVNGTKYFFRIASKSAEAGKGFFNSPEVSATPGVTSFVTSVNLGSARNNFTGWVGMAITVGSADVVVTQLGRIVGASNVQQHVIKLVEAGPAGVDLGSVTVTMPAGPVGEFAFASLDPPITLQAFRQYFLVSHEVDGGDQWFDFNTVVTTTSVASVTSPAYNEDASPGYIAIGNPGNTYVPVNFRY